MVADHPLPTSRPIYPGPILADGLSAYVISTNSAAEYAHGGLLSLMLNNDEPAPKARVEKPKYLLPPVELPSHGVQIQKLADGKLLILNQGDAAQLTLVDPADVNSRCESFTAWCAPTSTSPLRDTDAAHFEFFNSKAGKKWVIVSSVSSGNLELVEYRQGQKELFGEHRFYLLDKWLLDKFDAEQERSQIHVRDFRIIGTQKPLFFAVLEMPRKEQEGFEDTDASGTIRKREAYLVWAPIEEILSEKGSPKFNFKNLTEVTGSKQAQKMELVFADQDAPNKFDLFLLMHLPDTLLKISTEIGSDSPEFSKRILSASTCRQPLEMALGTFGFVSCMQDNTLVAYDLDSMQIVGRKNFFLAGPRALQATAGNQLLLGAMLSADIRLLAQTQTSSPRASLEIVSQFFESAPLNQPGG